jgi:hypothetical protein
LRRQSPFNNQTSDNYSEAMERFDQAFRRDGESATPLVEQSAEERARIEARRAHPGDSAVTPDQCGGRAVADQAMIFDRQIAVGGCNSLNSFIDEFQSVVVRSLAMTPRMR